MKKLLVIVLMLVLMVPGVAAQGETPTQSDYEVTLDTIYPLALASGLPFIVEDGEIFFDEAQVRFGPEDLLDLLVYVDANARIDGREVSVWASTLNTVAAHMGIYMDDDGKAFIFVKDGKNSLHIPYSDRPFHSHDIDGERAYHIPQTQILDFVSMILGTPYPILDFQDGAVVSFSQDVGRVVLNTCEGLHTLIRDENLGLMAQPGKTSVLVPSEAIPVNAFSLFIAAEPAWLGEYSFSTEGGYTLTAPDCSSLIFPSEEPDLRG